MEPSGVGTGTHLFEASQRHLGPDLLASAEPPSRTQAHEEAGVCD